MLRCRTVLTGASRPATHIRTLPALDIHDELGLAVPEADPSFSELLLATLGSCIAARIQANAATGNVTIRKLILELEAHLAVSPLWAARGSDPEPVGFETIQVKVHIDAPAPTDTLKAMLSHAMLWSPVANSLHSPVHLDVTLATPSAV